MTPPTCGSLVNANRPSGYWAEPFRFPGTTYRELTDDFAILSLYGGTKPLRVRADFNGLFGELLCLSHQDTCGDSEGNLVTLKPGMVLTAFDEDVDENGNRDDLIASGVVERSLWRLRCSG